MLPPPAMMTRLIGLSMRRSSVMTLRMCEVAAMMKTSSPLSMTVSPVGTMGWSRRKMAATRASMSGQAQGNGLEGLAHQHATFEGSSRRSS
jgi:hypothetical protein